MATSGSQNTRQFGAAPVATYPARVPMQASVKINKGAIVVANSSGNAAAATTATGLTCLGIADEDQDNTGGSAGALSILVRRGDFVIANNDSGDPIDQTMLYKTVYLTDDNTVCKTNGSSTKSAAGKFLGFEAATGLPIVEML